ncbi:MAG: thioredoxin-dependent thiol peroxidase [Spirosomataceae bacterium]
MQVEIGQKAPLFVGVNQKGEEIHLTNFLGKKVILYFYPKDNTPGCTAQACNLKDNYEQLLAAGYVVLGVSPDSVKSHVKFIDKFSLPFDLLADESHEIAELYGVWVEKSMYGRTYMGIARTTFVINEAGIIEEIIQKVDTKNHSAQLL